MVFIKQTVRYTTLLYGSVTIFSSLHYIASLCGRYKTDSYIHNLALQVSTVTTFSSLHYIVSLCGNYKTDSYIQNLALRVSNYFQLPSLHRQFVWSL